MASDEMEDLGIASNATDEYHQGLAHIIVATYIMPFLFVVGFFGNILSICVLRKRSFRNSTSVYLLVLAIVSFIYVIFYFPYIIMEFVTDGPDMYVIVMIIYQCRIGAYILHSMSNAALWMTAIVAVERCIVVGLPLYSRLICRRRYAWIACGVLIFGSLLMKIPKTMECSYLIEENPESPTGEDVHLIMNPEYDHLKSTLISMIISSFIPFVVTFISNAILVSFMVRRWKRTKHFSADGKTCNAVSNANAVQRRAITTVVVANVTLFLGSHLLHTILYIYIFARGMKFYHQVMDSSLGFFSNSLTFTFFCLSSVTYLIISRLYRKTAKIVILSVIQRSHTVRSTLVSSIARSRKKGQVNSDLSQNDTRSGSVKKSVASEDEISL